MTRQQRIIVRMQNRFLERLQSSRPVILDGATGTELARRGVDLSAPSWTAGIILDRPEVLAEIHRDYFEAGAEILTANTFRTHARNLESLGRRQEARELTCRAVDIARDAVKSQIFIAGSVAPLEDCYSPQLTPPLSQIEEEHEWMAENLQAAGVDLILIETQVTIREAELAAAAAQRTGLPFLVSFACNRAGNLISGEGLPQAFQAMKAFSPTALLVNCLPADEVLPTLFRGMPFSGQIPLGAYANTGRLLADGVWESTEGQNSAVYAEFAVAWKEAKIRIIGGCCGTTPEHISAISDRI